MQKKINNCLCCDSSNLVEHLNFGTQPLANSYHNSETVLDQFELKTNLCLNCFHLQLSISVDPDLLFKNYLYVSGTSHTLREYFKWFSYFVDEFNFESEKCNVLDIACNDGTQLNYFKALGYNTYGIDPAKNLFELSSVNHEIYCGYLDDEISYNWSNKFKFIIAQNVFAHTSDPLGFLNLSYNMLSTNGYLFIQTSQSDMILNGEFDTIYHEHISFFNSYSMFCLVNRTNFNFVDIIKSPIHGSSYIFVLKKSEKKYQLAPRTENFINYEKWKGLQNSNTYFNHAKTSINIIEEFTKEIEKYKLLGFKVIGYGAAAKGNTLLNAANVSLDVIIDDNELKWNLLCPGHNTKIISPNDINQFYGKDILFIPLAWNFYAEIIQKISKHIPNFKQFIALQYFPNVSINSIK
jgi:2-polyprenyl-3-methyl-5-hydroxy-6-metoxy-1,4-benzoquinol methylase